MINRLAIPSVAVLLFLAAGCSNEPQGPLTMISDDDPEFAATIVKAQETISEFVAALEDPPATARSFAVKKKFVDGDKTEFMWLIGITHTDGTFTGTLDNEAQVVTNATMGEQYSVSTDEVQDWLYIDGGEMMGGYSVKLLQQRRQAN